VIRRGVRTSHLTSPVKINVVSMVTKIPTQLWLPGRVVVVTRTVKRKAEGVIVGIHRVPMVVTIVVCQVLTIQMLFI
jgi:hypothetical protein